MNSSCEHVMAATSPPEGVTLRVMKASDLPHVRALHVSTPSVHAIPFVSPGSPFHAAQSSTCFLSSSILHSTSR